MGTIIDTRSNLVSSLLSMEASRLMIKGMK